MNILKLLNQFKNLCVNFVVDHPKKCLGITLIPFFVLSLFASKMEENYSVRMWFRTTDPHLIELDKFERDFGNDQMVLIGVVAKDGVFTPETMNLVRDLTEETWKIMDIVRVDSLSNYNHVSVEGDDINVAPFIPAKGELSPEFLEERKQIALKHNNILNRLVNDRGTIALIHAQMAPKFDGNESNYRNVTAAFENLLKKYERPGIEYMLLGAAPVNDAFRTAANHDLDFLTPISFLVIAIILALVLRTIAGVVVPLIAVGIVVLSSFGLAGILGVSFNNMTSAMPAIMLAICMAEIMHILVVYYRYCDDGKNYYEAMKAALDKNFYATFLTSISTTFGFIGQIFTELTPIADLGLLATFGTVGAWLLTIFFVSPLVMLIPYRSQDRGFMDVKLFKNPESFVDWIYRYYKLINASVIILLGASIYLALNLEVNTDPFSYFKDSYKLKRDNDRQLEEFKGLGGPQLVVQSGSESGINDPEFMRKVDEFEKWIEELPYVNQVVSILDVVKDVNQNLNGGNTEFYKIPAERKEIAETIFFYSMSLPAGMDLNNMMTMLQNDIRLSVSWSLTDSKTSLEETAKIEAKGKELGLKIYATGKTFLYNRMNDYVVDTFVSSNFWAILLVGTMMLLTFKSFKLGLLSLIPNLIPLIYGMGMLKLMGGTLDIGTCMVTSVCFGITVDDTIHFLLHYQSLRTEEKLPLREALIKIYDITAPALIFTTLLLVGGFGVFIMGDFVPNIYFGTLCALILTLGVFLELIFTPALLIALEKIVRKTNKGPA